MIIKRRNGKGDGEREKNGGGSESCAFFFLAHLFLAKGGRKAEQIR